MDYPFRGTCISLEDFEESHGFSFFTPPDDIDLNYLVSFCEYTYNIVKHTKSHYDYYADVFVTYIRQLSKVIDLINYMPNVTDDGITDFVPKDAAAISVAEIVKPELSYKVIEYNHHSMKGDLEGKRDILLSLADQLEPKRKELKQINSQLESDVFLLFNGVNIRHNNSDPNNNGKYNPCVAAMTAEQIEQWYDDAYQLSLLAFLELDNQDRKKRITQLRAQL